MNLLYFTDYHLFLPFLIGMIFGFIDSWDREFATFIFVTGCVFIIVMALFYPLLFRTHFIRAETFASAGIMALGGMFGNSLHKKVEESCP